MKALLASVKDHLVAELGNLLRAGDVFITPDVNFLPVGVRLPAVGIKDGPIQRNDRAGGVVEERLDVQLACWTELAKDEASIMGDESTEQIGVLELAETVRDTLTGRQVGIAGLLHASCNSEAGSLLLADDQAMKQQKVITMTFERET